MSVRNYTLTQFKIATFILATAVSTTAFATDTTRAELGYKEQGSSDIVGQLKSESKGVNRFRYGFYGAIGGQRANNSDVSPRISGLVLEGGVYTLMNPIKNFADIEVGASFKYNGGAKMTNENSRQPKYYNGLKQISAYAGPVFQFGGGKHAVGFGVSKAFYLGEVKGDDNDKTPKNDLSNGLGAYAEYQWMGQKSTNSSRHLIPFARLTIEKFDMEIANSNKTSDQTVVGLAVGTKY